MWVKWGSGAGNRALPPGARKYMRKYWVRADVQALLIPAHHLSEEQRDVAKGQDDITKGLNYITEGHTDVAVGQITPHRRGRLRVLHLLSFAVGQCQLLAIQLRQFLLQGS